MSDMLSWMSFTGEKKSPSLNKLAFKWNNVNENDNNNSKASTGKKLTIYMNILYMKSNDIQEQ